MRHLAGTTKGGGPTTAGVGEEDSQAGRSMSAAGGAGPSNLTDTSPPVPATAGAEEAAEAEGDTEASPEALPSFTLLWVVRAEPIEPVVRKPGFMELG
eukprot:CAMPEP_0183568260 /NCGR_PEP_ID=MMETSP0371-20130417/116715_1 /TAXON_ID=268820 /ORGANISM="Peridinium aciculiferum, Strain PAER-2" /LENGTH=97 /DNA_ID=CAMNT_0025777749 /DNA_START=143 /DNA_END=434 /DNA_ORIENTATION=+